WKAPLHQSPSVGHYSGCLQHRRPVRDLALHQPLQGLWCAIRAVRNFTARVEQPPARIPVIERPDDGIIQLGQNVWWQIPWGEDRVPIWSLEPGQAAFSGGRHVLDQPHALRAGNRDGLDRASLDVRDDAAEAGAVEIALAADQIV